MKHSISTYRLNKALRMVIASLLVLFVLAKPMRSMVILLFNDDIEMVSMELEQESSEDDSEEDVEEDIKEEYIEPISSSVILALQASSSPFKIESNFNLAGDYLPGVLLPPPEQV